MLCPSAYAPHVGGVEELTRQLAIAYRCQGHQVLVVTARWPVQLPAHEYIAGVEVRRLDYVMPNRHLWGLARFGVLFPLRLQALARLIRRFRPDIVHIQCVSAQGFYWGLLKRLQHFPLVVTLQGERRMDAAQVYQRARLMEPMLARLLRVADYVTACSQATLNDVADLWPVGPNSAVIPNGISIEEFDTTAAGANIPCRPYIFATGRHVHNKGFDVLIAAFARIADRYSDIDLVIGGDGPLYRTLQEQIGALDLTTRVRLVGFLDRAQTVAYFRHSRFFVLPSRYEPFGIVNLEAMAAGKAVIATNVGGVAEVVRAGETGMLIPSEDAVALAGAMEVLLADPNRAEVFGKAGRDYAGGYDWPQIAARYITVYRFLAEAKGVL